MQAKHEREFFLKFDKSFNTSTFLKRHKFINSFLILTFDIVCIISRKIFASKTNSKKVIGILSFHRLGDTVFTIPAVREIFNHYKDHKVIIFSYPETKSIYELEFPEENIVALDKNGFRYGRRIASKKIKNFIKKHSPDQIFDITGTPASASIIYNSRANVVVGMNIRFFKNLYTKFVPIRTKPHLMDRYMDIVTQVISVDHILNKYEFGIQIIQPCKIMIHPFAIRKAKEWNLNKFLNLASELIKEYDLEMISPDGFLSKDEMNEINQLNIPLTITADISSLIQKIREASFFISNDSGPTYIASLLHKPTFTIYGPTNPTYSLPHGNGHRFVRYQIQCSPIVEQYCYTHAGINCLSYECMNQLSVEKVLIEVRSFLDELGLQKTKHHIL